MLPWLVAFFIAFKKPAGKPLDVQGVDYATSSYDQHHKGNPVPLISSETSSAVSDRAIYANDPAAGHVTGYDTEHPGWGQTAEGAWGGTCGVVWSLGVVCFIRTVPCGINALSMIG